MGALAAVGTGCDDATFTVHDGAPPEAATPADWRVRAGDVRAPLDARLAAALEGIDAERCFGSAIDPATCAWAELEVDGRHVARDALGRQAVLIADFIAPNVDLLRYRHRVEGVFAFDVEGRVVRVPARFRVPRTFADVVTAFATTPHVPASALAPLEAPLRMKLGDHVPIACIRCSTAPSRRERDAGGAKPRRVGAAGPTFFTRGCRIGGPSLVIFPEPVERRASSPRGDAP